MHLVVQKSGKTINDTWYWMMKSIEAGIENRAEMLTNDCVLPLHNSTSRGDMSR